MAQATTLIFLLATLLISVTTVLGQTPPSRPAPSPTINEVVNCGADLAVCVPAISQEQAPSRECCTALKTTGCSLSSLCGFIRNPMIMVPFNVTAFNAFLYKTCRLTTTDPNLCSLTTATVELPQTIALFPGPLIVDKDAASTMLGTGLSVGIVFLTIIVMFYL